MNKTKKFAAAVLALLLLCMAAGCAESKDLMKPFRGESETTPASEYVTLGTYYGVEAEEVIPHAVSEQEVQSYILQIRYSFAEFTEEDRAAEMGDKVIISYVGYMDGEAFEGGASEGEEAILGMESYIPGFEEGIVGMRAGQTKMVDTQFPADYWSADYAGKSAQFEITLSAVYSAVLPAYDDAYIQEQGFESAEEYESYIRSSMQSQYDSEAEESQLLAVWEAVREGCTFHSYPEEEVQACIDDYVNYYSSMAEYYSTDLDTYLQENYGLTEAQFMEEMEAMAYETVGDSLIVQAIIEAEELELTEEEYSKGKLALLAQNGFGNESDFEAAYEMSFEDYYGEENIRLAILQEQVYVEILESAVLS